jgi:hypothetical protein
VERPRTGQRVDHPAFPGHAADHRRGAVVEATGFGGRQRADDVTAAADADHQRAS